MSDRPRVLDSASPDGLGNRTGRGRRRLLGGPREIDLEPGDVLVFWHEDGATRTVVTDWRIDETGTLRVGSFFIDRSRRASDG